MSTIVDLTYGLLSKLDNTVDPTERGEICNALQALADTYGKRVYVTIGRYYLFTSLLSNITANSQASTKGN